MDLALSFIQSNAGKLGPVLSILLIDDVNIELERIHRINGLTAPLHCQNGLK
jgi:hypothetical protein